MKRYPSQDKLRDVFDYYPDGILCKKDGSSQSNISVSPKHHTVHNKTFMEGKEYNTKDLVWIYHKGMIPENKKVKSKAGSYSARIEDLILSDCIGSIARNGKPNRSTTSRFLGVRKQDNLWTCQFSFESDKKTQYKGQFTTEESAAACYNFWAKKIFGRHAILNDVSPEIDFEKFRRAQGMPALKSRCSSGFKGVYANKSRWMAKIKSEYLGTFDTKEEAARAYNIAAYEHYGENAVLNDIPDPLGTGAPF